MSPCHPRVQAIASDVLGPLVTTTWPEPDQAKDLLLQNDADVSKYVPSEEKKTEAVIALGKLPRYSLGGRLLEFGGYGTCVCQPLTLSCTPPPHWPLHLPMPCGFKVHLACEPVLAFLACAWLITVWAAGSEFTL